MDIEVQDGLSFYNSQSNRSNTKGLIAETQKNYSIAQSYFLQKKKAMLQFIAKSEQNKDNMIQTAIVDGMQTLIIKKWSEIKEALLANVSVVSQRSGQYNIVAPTKEITIPEGWENQVSQWQSAIAEGAPLRKNIYSMLGQMYEQYLEQSLQAAVIKTADNAVNKVVNDFLNKITHTGSITATSSLRGNRAIRPDLGYNISKENAQNVELQAIFDLGDQKLPTKNLEYNFSSTVLQKYLESNQYGFSAKIWDKNISSKEFTQAKGLQDILNEQFRSYYQSQKTWNLLFAYRTMTATISRFLLDILGPTNIALITGNSFVWMDELLQDALFVMRIYTHKVYANNEIKPYIASSNVYIQYQRTRRLHQAAFSQFIAYNGEKYSAYQVNFKIGKKH